MRDGLRRGWIPLAAGLWALMIAGCGLWPVRGESEPGRAATLPELLARIESRTTGLESLKALIAVEAGGGQPFMAGMSWAKPGSLRVTGLSPFGSPMFEVTVSGGMVEWASSGRSPMLLGSVRSLRDTPGAHPKGMPVSVEDLILMLQVLTGPVLDLDEYPVLEHAGRFDLIHVIRNEDGRAQLTKRFYMDRRSLRLVREDLFGPEGTVRLRLDFKGYRATPQGEWPHRILVRVEGEGTEIGLLFKEFQFNPDLPREEFELRAEGAS